VSLLPYGNPVPEMMELLGIKLDQFLLFRELLNRLKELNDLLKKGLLFGEIFWGLKVSGDSSLI